jgi:hypothetical protein
MFQDKILRIALIIAACGMFANLVVYEHHYLILRLLIMGAVVTYFVRLAVLWARSRRAH